MLESKHYYIDLINSTKAYRFTSYYHYSGVGFKKAKINKNIAQNSPRDKKNVVKSAVK